VKAVPGRKKKAVLLGLGLDNQDGHVRATRGENFQLIGGSQDTHRAMQEKAVKFSEKLARRGKTLEQLEPNEFVDLAGECQMNVALPRPAAHQTAPREQN
jgi:hypothetical protein